MMARALRIAALILVPAALFAGVAAWQSGGLASVLEGWWRGAAPITLPTPFPSPHRTWAEHVAAIDAGIARNRTRAASEPTDWLSPSAEAANWLDRASMTGRWQDYAAAEAALAVATSRSPAAVVPHPLRARFAMAVHRNADAEPALRAATIDREFTRPENQAQAMAVRGDVALYAGDWRRADALYARAARLSPSETLAFRRAFIVQRTQGGDAAIAAWANVAQTSVRPSRRLLAALAQRIGAAELERGRWDAASLWHARAEQYLPGDWHISALRLQDRALAGDLPGAIGGMERLAAAHDLPELWDALAVWQAAAGSDNGDALGRAAAGWRAFGARYPLATASHQAEHALIAGDFASMLAFARLNYQNRPYGDAAIALAEALAANGEIVRARALLEQVAQDGWRNSEGDWLDYHIAELAGDGNAVAAARINAERNNPRALDPRSRLIVFGRH
ncbi:MAG: hypothetical protein AABZ45_00740 [Pseudomonadota bacterium]